MRPSSRPLARLFAALILCSPYIAFGSDENAKQETPQKAMANHAVDKIAQDRIDAFTHSGDFKVSLYAGPSLTQNPTFFSFDSQGRMLMAEIARTFHGGDDVRSYDKAMTIDDISLQSNEERLAMYSNHADKIPLDHYTEVTDSIRQLRDDNNDGIADSSTLFAGGFNGALDGLGSGVLERDGKVFYTNIPHLWVLEDKNDDGVSDSRHSLQDGFGIRVSFMGHDMHGLAWGPDGRMYWTIGDRGYSFTTKEGKVMHGPNLGVVFRANPDGSDIEIFYHGVRNATELVFDEYGNLFTADNDGDQSDTERVNHLIEGGDSGWHAGHQSIMSFTKRLGLRSSKYTGEPTIPVAWIVNDISKPESDYHPAFLLPGILQLFTGPSGITYNPTNYLGDAYRNTFFMAQYGGSPAGSFVSKFKVQPNGASFVGTEYDRMITGLNVADIEFGPDGRFYMSEFNFGGWSAANQGAVYVAAPMSIAPEIEGKHTEYASIFETGFTELDNSELIAFLSIDHQGIRQKAQFELANRGADVFDTFEELAFDPQQPLFTRIHSIWGMSQLVFNKNVKPGRLLSLQTLMKDEVDQVRIQSARVLGDHAAKLTNDSALLNTMIVGLNDTHSQTQMYSAFALSKLKKTAAVKPIIQKLESVGDSDLWLRHALVMGLSGIDKSAWFKKYRNHRSDSVRMALVLTLRVLSDSDVSYFLTDKNRKIVDESIITIDDKALIQARAALAKVLSSPPPVNNNSEAYIHHRIINANFNEGRKEDAERLLKYAAQPGLSNRLAAEALAAIEGWNDINPIDTITGLPTLANHDRADISDVIKQHLPDILDNVKGGALVQSMRIANAYNHELSIPQLIAITSDKHSGSEIRTKTLGVLAASSPEGALTVAKGMLSDTDYTVVSAALDVLFAHDPEAGLRHAVGLLEGQSIPAKKAVFPKLAKFNNAATDALLEQHVTSLLSDTLEPEVAFEVLQAGEKSSNKNIKSLIDSYLEKIKTMSLATQYAVVLEGGDARIGKNLFHGGGASECIRCHRVNNTGSSFVGPDLTGIGDRYDNQYLLEALIEPSAAVAPGFGNFTLTMKNGEKVIGSFYSENDEVLILTDAADEQIEYRKSDISEVKRPISGMPPMQYLIGKSEIRDVLAYLQSLQRKSNKGGH